MRVFCQRPPEISRGLFQKVEIQSLETLQKSAVARPEAPKKILDIGRNRVLSSAGRTTNPNDNPTCHESTAGL